MYKLIKIDWMEQSSCLFPVTAFSMYIAICFSTLRSNTHRTDWMDLVVSDFEFCMIFIFPINQLRHDWLQQSHLHSLNVVAEIKLRWFIIQHIVLSCHRLWGVGGKHFFPPPELPIWLSVQSLEEVLIPSPHIRLNCPSNWDNTVSF